MITKEQHQIIADVIELAEAEGNEFVKEELILYAKGAVENGETSVDSILTHFLDDMNCY